MKIGRRNAFILATIVAMLGTLIQMINKFTPLIVGRTIYGLGCGILSIIGPRFIEETVPDKLLSTCSPMFITTAAFGGFISMLLATALPDD
jgi:MFS family permease